MFGFLHFFITSFINLKAFYLKAFYYWSKQKKLVISYVFYFVHTSSISSSITSRFRQFFIQNRSCVTRLVSKKFIENVTLRSFFMEIDFASLVRNNLSRSCKFVLFYLWNCVGANYVRKFPCQMASGNHCLKPASAVSGSGEIRCALSKRIKFVTFGYHLTPNVYSIIDVKVCIRLKSPVPIYDCLWHKK